MSQSLVTRARSLADGVARWPATGLVALSALPLLFAVFNHVTGDVALYHAVGEALLAGELPYRDRVFEYPPYVLVWIIPPALLTGGLDAFRTIFAAQMLALDAATKWLLVREGRRLAEGPRALLPLALFSLAGYCAEYHYLKRFDLVPAFMVLLALLAVSRGRAGRAGFWLALGVGTKLYPLVLAPVFAAAALKQRSLMRWCGGFALGLLPLAGLSLIVPWWRFVAFHAGRGLQVESAYAAFLWLAKHLGAVDAAWVHLGGWYEVMGEAAAGWAPIARVIFALASFASAALAVWRLCQIKAAPALPALANALLVPALGFVAFNYVLSPQYLTWLAALAALTLLGPGRGVAMLFAAACVLTPIFYPSRSYAWGLDLPRTVALVVRDLALLVAWGWSLAQLWAAGAEASSSAGGASAKANAPAITTTG